MKLYLIVYQLPQGVFVSKGKPGSHEKQVIRNLFFTWNLDPKQIAKEVSRSLRVVCEILDIPTPGEVQGKSTYLEVLLPSTGEVFKLRIPLSATVEDREALQLALESYYEPNEKAAHRALILSAGEKLRKLVEEESLEDDSPS